MEQKQAKNDEKKMALSRCERFGYGVGHVFNDLCAAMWFTYSLIFYEFVMKFSSVDTGIIMLIGQIADALATPIIGIISDRTSLFGKYGKRKSWHLLGTICVIATMPFLYSPCIMCEDAENWKRLIYYSVFVIVFQFGWAAVQIAHLALVPDLTNDDIERTDLLSIRNSFTILSNLGTYTITWIALEMNHKSEKITPDDKLKFQIIDYSICIAGLLMSLIFLCTVHEDEPEPPLLPENETIASPTRLSFKELFSKLHLYQVALIYTCTRLFCNVSQSLIPLYLHQDLALNRESIAIVPFIMYVSSFVTSWITTQLNEWLGRKLAFTTGCAIGLSGCVWIWFGTGYDYKVYCVYAVAVLIGAAYSIQLVTSLAITADLIGNDVGNGAFIYGIMSFADKLSNGAVIMVIQSLSSPTSVTFYTDSLAYVCGASSIIGFLSVMTIRSRSTPTRDGEENTAYEE